MPDEGLVFLGVGPSVAVGGGGGHDAVQLDRVAAHAVDAEHEERADDRRDAGGEERGRVLSRAVVDPACSKAE